MDSLKVALNNNSITELQTPQHKSETAKNSRSFKHDKQITKFKPYKR